MLTPPRIIAIDDEPAHLAGLTKSLNLHGIACLPIHFTGDPAGIKACPDVRIVFADLHLIGPETNHAAHFSMIGGLLEDAIRPAGPYFILLWTRYPEQASALREFLGNRLRGVTKPFDVLPLAKSDHLDAEGDVRDAEALVKAILDITEALPQLGALFDWESRVLGATGHTVSSILELASAEEADNRAAEVGRILTRLGIEAVGEPNVADDRFRAINEALFPILADRIANLHSSGSQNDVWREAVKVSGPETLAAEQAAKLNSMAHFAQLDSADECERGAVVMLPEAIREKFNDEFGVDEKEAAKDQFRCKDFDPKDENLRWVLVQVQAACDYAQRQPGSLPCYLALDLPKEHRRSKTPPGSLWSSPTFELDGTIRLLHANARFPVLCVPQRLQRGRARVPASRANTERPDVQASQLRRTSRHDFIQREIATVAGEASTIPSSRA